MRPRNRRIGDAVRGQVKDILRGWSFEVVDHDDDGRHGPPGDLYVGDGSGARLAVEIKAVAEIAGYGRRHTSKERTYPGRPYLTREGHRRLLQAGGLYIFAVYKFHEDCGPVVINLHHCDVTDIAYPEDWSYLFADGTLHHQLRPRWHVPWAIWQDLPGLGAEEIRWAIMRSEDEESE